MYYIYGYIHCSSIKIFLTEVVTLLSRFFTIHGSADEIIPVEDAYEFAKLIPNHKLCVIEEANHCYTAHRKELSDALVESITSSEV